MYTLQRKNTYLVENIESKFVTKYHMVPPLLIVTVITEYSGGMSHTIVITIISDCKIIS